MYRPTCLTPKDPTPIVLKFGSAAKPSYDAHVLAINFAAPVINTLAASVPSDAGGDEPRVASGKPSVPASPGFGR